MLRSLWNHIAKTVASCISWPRGVSWVNKKKKKKKNYYKTISKMKGKTSSTRALKNAVALEKQNI